jgi:hypothetical protein
MAVTTTHNVDAQDVLDELPVQNSKVTATSNSLNTTKIEEWINRASGTVNALLNRVGVDPTQLGDDEAEFVRGAIIAYACARSAIVVPTISESVRESFWDTWKDARRTLKDSPQDLGKSQSSPIKSNVDTQEPTEKKWDSSNFRGW